MQMSGRKCNWEYSMTEKKKKTIKIDKKRELWVRKNIFDTN